MATDRHAEASPRKKKVTGKKKKKVKSITLLPPPPTSPPEPQSDEELRTQKQKVYKPSAMEVGDGPESVVAAAASPVAKGKRRLVVDEEEVEEEDAVDDGLVAKSAPTLSAVPDTTEASASASAAAAVATPSAKKPGCKWGDADQLTLLKEMVGFTEQNGPCKLSKPYMTSFRSSLPEGSSTCKFSVKEILEKVKDLKRMHANPNGMGKGNGKGRKPLALEMVELSVKLWGEAGKGTVQKKKRKIVEEVQEVIEDDKNDNDRMDEDDDDGGGRGALLWEEWMVGLCNKKFGWSEKYSKAKIALVGESARDSMTRDWKEVKVELDTAIINLILADTNYYNTLRFL